MKTTGRSAFQKDSKPRTRRKSASTGSAGKKAAGFPHSEHLTGMDFLKVMAKGRKHSCDGFHLYYTAAESFQAGVSVSRKLGNAVVRNRIKRVLRESIRLTKAMLARPCHLVLVAREGAEKLDVIQAITSLKQLYGLSRLASATELLENKEMVSVSR